MKKVIGQVFTLLFTIKEELRAFDVRTDITKRVLNRILLTDDFEDDVYYDDDEDELETGHFGIVGLMTCGIFLLSLWLLTSTMIIFL